jgi:hypothetical protein
MPELIKKTTIRTVGHSRPPATLPLPEDFADVSEGAEDDDTLTALRGHIVPL